MIKKFIQSDTMLDRELFCLIGPWATSRKISKELGSSIFSDPGDIWHIAIGPYDKPVGFALTHLFSTTKTAHIRFLYVPDGNKRIQADLLAEVLLLVRDHELESLYTYDHKDAVIWQKAGFTKHKKSRSSFYKWEKIFKETK